MLADAGFVGWDTMNTRIEAGQLFIIRGGANVRWLKKRCGVREYGQGVYLWPRRQQQKKVRPIVRRRVTVRQAGGRPMCLLTNGMDADRLDPEPVAGLYTLRWRVEVSCRWFKRTPRGVTMLSTSARNACVALDWTLTSLWVLTRIG